METPGLQPLSALEIAPSFPVCDCLIEGFLLQFRGVQVVTCDESAKEELRQVASFPGADRFWE